MIVPGVTRECCCMVVRLIKKPQRSTKATMEKEKVKCIRNKIPNGSRPPKEETRDLIPTVAATDLSKGAQGIGVHVGNNQGINLRKRKGDSEQRRTKRVSQRQEEFSTAPITVPEMQQEQNTISNTDAEVNAKSMVLEYGPSTELVDVNMEKDPKLVKESVEFGKDNLDDVVMDIDDSGINMEGTEELVSGDEDFQNLTDGEMEDLNIVQEDTGGNTEGVPPTGRQEMKNF
ncbi:hypothetical protein Bca52824_002819 [Brassica carinata]|uniref:Uncharacterized protein n=1 Tax=Brassica carinata TaxID=52824 RepID=A0A8X7WKX6_BRACI|nr:hypothetical protein Bca52824_002819 [Brassica carinata]